MQIPRRSFAVDIARIRNIDPDPIEYTPPPTPEFPKPPIRHRPRTRRPARDIYRGRFGCEPEAA
ncbi:hypothetical protein ACFVMC_11500 [Nocardia sp. NPDC127579]|uniref:hypothetical protein n=1 Tax=Nocardia sp. NPDC127579 TaxID=3345402 RepID=UPI0036342469